MRQSRYWHCVCHGPARRRKRVSLEEEKMGKCGVRELVSEGRTTLDFLDPMRDFGFCPNKWGTH